MVEAENGEALDLVEQARPDLVLIGDPEGLELCRQLREGRSWGREVPVILLGGQESDPVDRVRAFDRGCDDYLDRPFHYDELVARIRAVLRRTAPPESERLEAGGIEIDRPTRRVTVGRRASDPADEGIRATGEARERSAPRVHEGRAAPRRLGLQVAREDAHARLARVTPSPPPVAARRCCVRAERLGRWLLPPRRLTQARVRGMGARRCRRYHGRHIRHERKARRDRAGCRGDPPFNRRG